MWSTEFISLTALFFATGFAVGFGHCIGMCGPIVVSVSLNTDAEQRWPIHLFYNAGRSVTYALMGGVLGATGSFTALASEIAGLQKAVMIGTGLLIVVMGLAMAGWLPTGRIFSDKAPTSGFFSQIFKAMGGSRRPVTYFPLGMVLGLLPCGPVYTALLAVVRSGMGADGPVIGFFRGFLLMLAFGGGTAPALLVVCRLASMKWLKSRNTIYRTGAVLMVVAGVWFAVTGFRY